jgi:hypothetical protein
MLEWVSSFTLSNRGKKLLSALYSLRSFSVFSDGPA